MRLAEQISYIMFALMVVMVLILIMPDTMYGKGNYQEIKARCTSDKFVDRYCKLRTTDNAIYFNGKWHNEYFVSATIMVDDKLNLLILKKGQ